MPRSKGGDVQTPNDTADVDGGNGDEGSIAGGDDDEDDGDSSSQPPMYVCSCSSSLFNEGLVIVVISTITVPGIDTVV